MSDAMIDKITAEARATAIALNRLLDELEAKGVSASVLGDPTNKSMHQVWDVTRVRLTLTQPDHRALAGVPANRPE